MYHWLTWHLLQFFVFFFVHFFFSFFGVCAHMHMDLLTCFMPMWRSEAASCASLTLYFECMCVWGGAWWCRCVHMCMLAHMSAYVEDKGYTGIFPQSLSTFHFLRKSPPQGTQSPLTPLDCPKSQWASEMCNKTLKTKIQDGKISHVPGLTELILQKKWLYYQN